MKNICLSYYNPVTDQIDLVQMVYGNTKVPFVLGDLNNTHVIQPWTEPTLSYELSMCNTMDEASWRTKKYLEALEIDYQ